MCSILDYSMIVSYNKDEDSCAFRSEKNYVINWNCVISNDSWGQLCIGYICGNNYLGRLVGVYGTFSCYNVRCGL